MLNKIKPKSEFNRNVLTLMTGITVAQAIPVAISPVLTRLYTPEDFGIFALNLSLISIFAATGGARYDSIILLPKMSISILLLLILGLSILTLLILLLFVVFALFNVVCFQE